MTSRERTRAAGAMIASALSLLLPTAAMAHVGVEAHGSFFSGLVHPLGGIDHLAAMIAVGLWAAMIGGNRIWIWPAAFVGAMIGGGILGYSGVHIPFVEPTIAASALVLGLAIAFAVRAPIGIGVTLIAAAGIFHGHAHGMEAPAGDWLGYVAGFVLATALLHAGGIAVGRILKSDAGLIAARALGGVTAVLGLVLLAQ